MKSAKLTLLLELAAFQDIGTKTAGTREKQCGVVSVAGVLWAPFLQPWLSLCRADEYTHSENCKFVRSVTVTTKV